MNPDYEVVIGLEVHVQLNTQSKIFCADANSFGELPNRHTSAISLAHPGTLPRVNKKAIEKGIQLALAIGARINQENRFDRKHYFYPDLPKAYQITQDRLPICVGGQLDMYEGENERLIRFHHTHMEEDAGKSIHDIDPTYSMIDLNRAGTPLLEIVTEPDLRSPQEVYDFIAILQHLVRYIGISDANMEEGSLRADCNVSVRKKGETILNNRCEIKNINSKKFAKEAVSYEAKRQISLMEQGEKIEQQTLQFNPETGKTSPIRDKEDAHDYRYFPDPDLPPVFISDEQIETIQKGMPLLPKLKRQIYLGKNIHPEQINVITQEREYADYFDQLIATGIDTTSAANHFVNTVLPDVKDKYNDQFETFPLSIDQQAEFLSLIDAEEIVRTTAIQQLWPALLDRPSETARQLCEELNLFQSNDSDLIEQVIAQIINDHPDEVNKYKKGKKGLIGFFVGQAMKLTKGQSNPKVLQEKIKAALGKN